MRESVLPLVDFATAQQLGVEKVDWDRICDRFGRAPNEVEIQVFAALSEETVSFKSVKSLLNTIYQNEAGVAALSGSTCQAVDIGEGQLIVQQLLPGNSIAALAPDQATVQSVGTALLDIAAVGAQPLLQVALTRTGAVSHPRSLIELRTILEKLTDFSNISGIPLSLLDTYTHDNFQITPLFNSGVVGVLQKRTVESAAAVPASSPILYVGIDTYPPVGHAGKALAAARAKGLVESQEETSPLLTSYVDPYFTLKMVSALVEAHESNLLLASANLTAGLVLGLTSIATHLRKPFQCDLNSIPSTYGEPTPLELLRGRSANRLLVVTSKDNARRLTKIFARWGVPSTQIGQITEGGSVDLVWNHKTIADIPLALLTREREHKQVAVVKYPPMLKQGKRVVEEDTAPQKRKIKTSRKVDEWELIREAAGKKKAKVHDVNASIGDTWLDLLANPNLASRDFFFGQVDLGISGNCWAKPANGSTVFRLPKSTSATERGLAVSLVAESLYVSVDPYLGTAFAVSHAMRNIAARGGRPVTISYCFNFGSPANKAEYSDLSESVRAFSDACRYWQIPISSEHVSSGNGSNANPILATPALLMTGVIDDISLSVTPEFKESGDIVLLIGETANEISCSEYTVYTTGQRTGQVPEIDFDLEVKVCDLMRALLGERLLRSAYCLGAGGLAAAVSDCCLLGGRPIGVTLTIPQSSLKPEVVVFSESSRRYLVSCKPDHVARIRERCKEFGFPITVEGKVGGKNVTLKDGVDCTVPVSTLYRLWSRSMLTEQE